MQAHKIIRAINRRCDIAFETPDGKISYDDIELPLPYDLNAPVCEIGDADYPFFLRFSHNRRKWRRPKWRIIPRRVSCF